MWTFGILFTLLICFLRKSMLLVFSYWSNKGVIGPKPDLVFGNLRQVIWSAKYSLIMVAAKFYNDYLNEKVVGVYQGLTPTLVVRDPELIKTVIIKDFSCFNSRGLRIGKTPLMNNLFVAEEDHWKFLRQCISPIFTNSKLKAMIPLVNKCVERHMSYVDEIVTAGNTSQELRKLSMKYTIKSVSSTVFNKKFNTYAKDTTEVENVGYTILRSGPFMRIWYLLRNIYLEKMIDFLYTNYPRFTQKFFVNLARELIQKRNVEFHDKGNLIEQMISCSSLKKHENTIETKRPLEINVDLITAQTALFFAAGFETTSSTMSFMLYELALNPNIQAKCQMEIDAIMEKYNNTLDFDAVTKEFQYLSMVMDETLRKYPVGGLLSRQCVTDYTFKDINLTIKKGTKLWIPTLALHNDPKYFPEPQKFDPERFSSENRQKTRDYYYPFGGGPRNCIGMRFARLQFLLCVAHFLHKFQVSPCAKTCKNVQFDPVIITLAAEGGIWLNIEKRNRR